MPRKKKDVVPWDEELARLSEIAAKAEAKTGGLQFFSTRGGSLSWQDSPIQNDEMGVIILHSIFENVYYEGRYDPDDVQPPTCFAFAEEEDDLIPHDIIVKAGTAQSTEGCTDCEHNQWGTAETGRGKACRNTRRLGLLLAGEFGKDGDFTIYDDSYFESASPGYLRLPVTSVRGYGAYVKQMANAFRRPPCAMVTRISLEPDPKTQFKVTFTALEKVSDELIGTILQRREEISEIISTPYMIDNDSESPPPKKRGRKASTKKAPAKKASGRSRRY